MIIESITYIYALRLVNPERFSTILPEEAVIINQHFERLEKALDEGKLILAGPVWMGLLEL